MEHKEIKGDLKTSDKVTVFLQTSSIIVKCLLDNADLRNTNTNKYISRYETC